jgi:putative pyrroloquinoline-quinone-binding quinoprotein
MSAHNQCKTRYAGDAERGAPTGAKANRGQTPEVRRLTPVRRAPGGAVRRQDPRLTRVLKQRRRFSALGLIAFGALATSVVVAQGRGGAEWTTAGYDAQRTASIRTDPRLSVQTLQKPGEFGPFKFLWKIKLEYDPKAATALTQPILLDRIIGFRGFKSIAFVGTQSETVHAIDVDFGTPLWKYHINYSASPPPVLNVTSECPGGLTAALSRPTNIAPPVPGAAAGGGLGRGGRSGGGVGEPGKGAITLATAGQQRFGGAGGAAGPGGRGRAGAPPGTVPGSAAAAAGNTPGGLPPGARGAGGGGVGGGAFVPGADAAYVVGSDGFLHALNVQNGADLMPATLFVPANTRTMGLLIANDPESGTTTAYTATTHGCGSQPDAVWAMELASEKKDVVAFQTKGATIAGSAGPSLGRDGTVYLTTAAGSSPLSNSIIALEARTLKQKAAATIADAGFTSSPVVFQLGDKDVLAVAGKGKIYLFDPSALPGGPIATAALPGTGKLESGALSSWVDGQNVRWLASPSARGIVAFKITDAGGKPSIQPGWTSRDIASPLSPLFVNGVLFTASSGTKLAPSVLYAIDASSGKDLWNSGRTIATPVKSGLSAGQGNVYVPGADGTLYAFGFAIEK